MSHIFISYSHDDSEYAHRLVEQLEQEGFTAWIDERIDYGTQWPRVIEKHVDECSAFIVIMTPRSHQSEWVQNELGRAKEKGKHVFPLLLEGEQWLLVQATLYVDVRGGKLPPEDFYEGLSQVMPRQADEKSRAKTNWQRFEDQGDQFWEKANSILISGTLESAIEDSLALKHKANEAYRSALPEAHQAGNLVAITRLRRKVARYMRDQPGELDAAREEVEKGLEAFGRLSSALRNAHFIEKLWLYLELAFHHLYHGGDDQVIKAKAKAEEIIGHFKQDQPTESLLLLGDAWNVLGITSDLLKSEGSVAPDAQGCWIRARGFYQEAPEAEAKRKMLDLDFNIAVAWQKQGDYKKAIAGFDEILEKLPPTRLVLAKHNLALGYLDKGDLAKAVELAAELWSALEEDSTDAIWARELKLRICTKQLALTIGMRKAIFINEADELYQRGLVLLAGETGEDLFKPRKRSEMHRLMAEVNLAADDPVKAEELITQADREVAPWADSDELAPDVKADLSFTRALVDQRLNRLGPALESLKSLRGDLEREKEIRKVIAVEIHMAQILIKQGDRQTARPILETAKNRAMGLNRDNDRQTVEQMIGDIEAAEGTA